MSSFRVILRNLLRSFLCTVLSIGLSALLVAILTAVVSFFMRIGGAKEFSGNPYWGIVGLIPSAVVLFFFYCLGSNVGYRDSALFLRRKKHIYKMSGVRLLLILHLLIAVAAIALYVFCIVKSNEIFIAKSSDNTETYNALFECYIYAILGSIFSCQIGYYIVVIHFCYKNVVCPNCKHVLCVERDYIGTTDLGKTTRYKTTTQREKVGSIEYGDEKADVYANVPKTYVRSTQKSCKSYGCECKVCGHQWGSSEINIKYGD